MFFGNLFRRTEPRGLTWTPRYHVPEESEYDPDDDEQFMRMRQQSRVQFERYRRHTGGRARRGPSPYFLLIFVILVGAVIWTGQRGAHSMKIADVQIGAGDAVPQAPAVPRESRFDGEELIIEIETADGVVRDTLRGAEIERALQDESTPGAGR